MGERMNYFKGMPPAQLPRFVSWYATGSFVMGVGLTVAAYSTLLEFCPTCSIHYRFGIVALGVGLLVMLRGNALGE